MDSSSSGKSCTLESDLDHDIVCSDRFIPSRAGFNNVELGCTVMDGQGSDLDGNHSGERERDFINEIFHIYTCISLISTCVKLVVSVCTDCIAVL